MQVNNSQPSFGDAKYSLGRSPFVREAVDSIKPAVNKLGEIHDIKLKAKSTYSATPESDYYSHATAIVSKINKTPFEKVLHFFHLMPRATVSTKDLHMSHLDKGAVAAQCMENIQAAIKKFTEKSN